MSKVVKYIQKILFTSGLKGYGYQTIEAKPVQIIETTEDKLVYRDESGKEIELPESISYSIVEDDIEKIEFIKALVESE